MMSMSKKMKAVTHRTSMGKRPLERNGKRMWSCPMLRLPEIGYTSGRQQYPQNICHVMDNMCLVLYMIILSVFVTWMVYECPHSHWHWAILWLYMFVAPNLLTELLQYTLWKRQKDWFEYHYPCYIYFDWPQGLYIMSSLSTLIDALLIWDRRFCIGLMNNIMVGLRSPAPTGFDCICNKAWLMSWLVSIHF